MKILLDMEPTIITYVVNLIVQSLQLLTISVPTWGHALIGAGVTVATALYNRSRVTPA